jgi:hypothetical protein
MKEVKRKPIPYGRWFIMVMKERPLDAISLPESVRKNIEATGREELLIVAKGPDCKFVEVGHVIRPHGIIGKMSLDGEEYFIGNEAPEPPGVSCHIGGGK